MNSGSAASSATTSSSDGPARPSIEQAPYTCRFASVTHTLPGPTILSTRAIVSVPYAAAAIACAPPTAYNSSTSHSQQANSTAGAIFPSRCGGVKTIVRETPATFAGTTLMITDDGNAALPPGT